jgi:hypothetical protein
MDLREEILKEHSRKQAEKIAGWTGNNKKRFSLLIDLFLNDEYRVAQRAAYPLMLLADKYPLLAEEYVPKMVKKLYDGSAHPAVRRNILRTFQFVKIPARVQAEVIDFCIRYLTDPKEPIAVKCYSITVLVKLVKLHPELKQEAELVISQALKNSSMGVKVRIKLAMKEFENLG